MTRIDNGKHCSYPGCTHLLPPVRFPFPHYGYMMLWDGEDSRVYYGLVCGTHDRNLGIKNLVELAGMTVQQARQFHMTGE